MPTIFFARLAFLLTICSTIWLASSASGTKDVEVSVADTSPSEITPDFSSCNCSHQRLEWENSDMRYYRKKESSNLQSSDKAKELTQFRPAVLAPNAEPEINEVPAFNSSSATSDTVINVAGVPASSIGIEDAPGACSVTILQNIDNVKWSFREACFNASSPVVNLTREERDSKDNMKLSNDTRLTYCYEDRTLTFANNHVLALSPLPRESTATYEDGKRKMNSIKVGIVELITKTEVSQQQHPIAAYYISADIRHSNLQNLLLPLIYVRATGDAGLKFTAKVTVPSNFNLSSTRGDKSAHRILLAIDSAGGQVSTNIRELTKEEEAKSFEAEPIQASSEFYQLTRRVEFCNLTRARSSKNFSVSAGWHTLSTSITGFKLSEFNISIGMLVDDSAGAATDESFLAKFLDQKDSKNIGEAAKWITEFANVEIHGVL